MYNAQHRACVGPYPAAMLHALSRRYIVCKAASRSIDIDLSPLVMNWLLQANGPVGPLACRMMSYDPL